MDKVNQIKSLKQRHERGASVEDVLKEFEKDVSDYDDIIIVAKNKNEELVTSFSVSSWVTALGMLDIAKGELFN